METRILRLEDEFWRIRTDTGELAETERNALRAYLDEKGVKTAMIDDNLVIAGKLTWTEIFEPIQGFYEGKADVYPFLNLSPQKGEASTRLGKKRYPSPPPSRLNAGDPFPSELSLKERKIGRSTVENSAFADCVSETRCDFRTDSPL